jgi:hypothetical protein
MAVRRFTGIPLCKRIMKGVMDMAGGENPALTVPVETKNHDINPNLHFSYLFVNFLLIRFCSKS